MKERIILAPSLNGNELTKNLSLHGINSFNTRMLSAGELARIALLRSGITITEDFIDENEQVVIIAEAVKGIEYFKNPSFVDIRNIAFAINRMRCLVSEWDEEKVLNETLGKGIFKTKNDALLEAYKRYIQTLKDKDAVDSILLIRKAIAEASALDAEFVTLLEYLPNPLEEALLQKVSGGKEISSISITTLFDAADKSIKNISYKNCYGASNEVETILTDIYSGKNVDECTVAVTDTVTYGQLFFDYAVLYDIPMTFGCGIPIMNSNPAKLLNLYYSWMTDGFFGAEAIKTLLNSEAFDMSKLTAILPKPEDGFSWNIFYEVLGQVKFRNESEIENLNKVDRFKKALSEDEALVDKTDPKACKTIALKKLCIPFLEVMAKELALDTVEFISKYSYIRIGDTSCSKALLMRLDFEALNEIKEQMMLINKVDVPMTKEDIILSILKNNILVQQNAPGKMHVTSVDGAITSIRKNIFIAGLSATKYPGSPKENYLLLDDDLRLFGSSAERYTSVGRIENKKNRLFELARLASMLDSSICVSYSGLNVSELKSENASSLIYELFKEEHGSNVTSEQLKEHITKIGYFEPGLSISRLIGKEYINGTFIITNEHNREKRWPEQTFEREFSPSALEMFVGCPKAFFLKHIMNLSAPDDDDPFEIISPRAEGTLAHSLMELLADEPNMSLDDFKVKAEEYFDRYIDEHAPLISKNVEPKKTLFVEMMENAYNTDPKPRREVVLKEEDIHCEHEVGIKLHGFPDRVERLEDGTCLIVDYKTGNKIKHIQNDPNTCLQVLIYAYLMEKMGYKISSCEYRYIRLGQTVTCDWNEDTKNGLAMVLNQFKHDMRFGEFYTHVPNPDDKDAIDPCKFCKYGTVCDKEAR